HAQVGVLGVELGGGLEGDGGLDEVLTAELHDPQPRQRAGVRRVGLGAGLLERARGGEGGVVALAAVGGVEAVDRLVALGLWGGGGGRGGKAGEQQQHECGAGGVHRSSLELTPSLRLSSPRGRALCPQTTTMPSFRILHHRRRAASALPTARRTPATSRRARARRSCDSSEVLYATRRARHSPRSARASRSRCPTPSYAWPRRSLSSTPPRCPRTSSRAPPSSSCRRWR